MPAISNVPIFSDEKSTYPQVELGNQIKKKQSDLQVILDKKLGNLMQKY
jgi:hypothetical protein